MNTSVIVIGASAGGVEAIRFLAAALPAELPVPVFIVLHIGAQRSELPWLLNQGGRMRAVHPADGDPIRPGTIYVAPPDHHMTIEPPCIRLTRGPRENWARPAIDPLFRSAARHHGAGAVGVVLTGGLNDGTAGLFEIKQAGGTTVVQDPADALHPAMPRSALAHVAVDHCLKLAEIPALLTRLAAQSPGRTGGGEAPPTPAPRDTAMTADYKLDQPTAVTCPDCGGALNRTELGTLVRFSCHIGHVYTAEVMVAAQFAALEIQLAAAMRALSERGELCRQMAAQALAAGHAADAAQWTDAMGEAKERTEPIRLLLEAEWRHPCGTEPRPPSFG